MIVKYTEIEDAKTKEYIMGKNDIIIPNNKNWYSLGSQLISIKRVLTILKLDFWSWQKNLYLTQIDSNQLVDIALFAIYADPVISPSIIYHYNGHHAENFRAIDNKEGLLSIINKHKVIIAGGYLTYISRVKYYYANDRSYPCDVDLFPTQNTDINALINDIQNMISEDNLYYIVKTKRTVTFKSPKLINIQISLSRCDNKEELLELFDLDASKICYWQGEIYLTKTCLESIKNNTIIINQNDKFNHNTVNRLLKYNHYKNFKIIIKDALLTNANQHSLLFKLLVKFKYKNPQYRDECLTMYDIQPSNEDYERGNMVIEDIGISGKNHKFLRSIYTDIYRSFSKTQIIFLQDTRDILFKNKFYHKNIIEIISSLYTTVNTYAGKDNFYEFIPNYENLIANYTKLFNIELEPTDEKFQFKSIMEILEKKYENITFNGNIYKKMLDELLPMIPSGVNSIIYDYYNLSQINVGNQIIEESVDLILKHILLKN
jgi:hypothetical protein